jgi:hypothetical protein
VLRNLLFLALLVSAFTVFSQETVSLQVKIVDENNNPVPYVDVANRRLQLGFSSNKEGYFTTRMLKTDSLVLLKKGYIPQKLSLKDSVSKGEYIVTLRMPRMPIELTEVQINAIKTHQQIRQSINQIYTKSTDLHPDAMPLTNPLSYLYELISKKEKEKRLAASLEAEASKRIVLKELFRLYNSYDIIDLPEDDYDNFISYINMPYEFMQRVSDYDLAVTIKKLYKAYRADKSNWIKHELYPPAIDDLQHIKIENSKN